MVTNIDAILSLNSYENKYLKNILTSSKTFIDIKLLLIN